MKATLNIDATVMAALGREAARQKKTISELVEAALRLMLAQRVPAPLPQLPSFRGRSFVNIAGRDALYRAMEG